MRHLSCPVVGNSQGDDGSPFGLRCSPATQAGCGLPTTARPKGGQATHGRAVSFSGLPSTGDQKSCTTATAQSLTQAGVPSGCPMRSSLITARIPSERDLSQLETATLVSTLFRDTLHTSHSFSLNKEAFPSRHNPRPDSQLASAYDVSHDWLSAVDKQL